MRKLTINGYIAVALLLQISVLLIRLTGMLIYRNFALLFESFHILTDMLVTIVVFAAVKLSNSKYSKRYSYGLFRIEDLVSLAIAVLIVYTAVSLLLNVLSTTPSSNLESGMIQLASVVPLYLSGIVKIVGGRAVNSPSLVSDGYNNYSDVYVGVGVGTGLLVSFATNIGIFYFLAIGIAAIGILYTAFKIGRDSVIGIMDLPKDKKVIPKIADIVKQNKEVTDIKTIKARWAGPVIFVEIVLTMNSKITMEEAHDVADSLEKRVLSEISDIRDVVIHIEPSKNSERVVIVPTSEHDKIDMKTSKSLSYLIVTIKDGARVSSKNVQIPLKDITSEKNAERVLSIARQHLVTDALVLSVGEVLSSLLVVNHIEVWKAKSESVEENLDLLVQNKLSRLRFD